MEEPMPTTGPTVGDAVATQDSTTVSHGQPAYAGEPEKAGKKPNKYIEGMYRFADQWPVLRYLGLGAWWAWVWLSYNSTGLSSLLDEGAQPMANVQMYFVSTFAISLCMLLAVLRWRECTRLLDNRKVLLGSGALATAATLCLGYSPFIGGTPTFIVAAALTGVGTSTICLETGRVYGTLPIRDSITSGAISLIFATFLYFMGTGVPQPVRIPFIACMPLLAAFLLAMPANDPFSATTIPQKGLGRESTGRKSFIHLIVANALVAVTAELSNGLAASTLEREQYASLYAAVILCIFILAAIVCFVINCGDVVKATRRVYSGLMLLGIFVLLASCFGLNLGFMNIGKSMLWMIFTCMMSYMVFRFDFSPVRAYGIGQMVYFIVSALAWYAGVQLAGYYELDSMRYVVAIVMAFVIVLVLTFVFTDADIKFILTWRASDEERSAIRFGVDATGMRAGAFDGQTQAARPVGGDGAPEVVVVVSPEDGKDAGLGRQGAAGTGGQGVDAGPRASAQNGDADVPLTLEQQVERLDPKLGVSSREKEILVLFAQGRSANWIAEELTISKNTVRSHLRAIYVKLDVHTRQELLDRLSQIR